MRLIFIALAVVVTVAAAATIFYAEEKPMAPAPAVSKEAENAAPAPQKKTAPDNVGLETYGVEDSEEPAAAESYDDNTGLKDVVPSDSQW